MTMQAEAAGHNYKKLQSPTYLEGAVLQKSSDMPVEIAGRSRACWMRIRWCLRELYDQPKVKLSLKIRMMRAKAIENLLYGCST